MNKTVSPLTLPRAAAILGACMTLAAGVRAGTITWDADTGTAGAQDGTGTWNTTASNWYDGATNTTWNNASTDTAVFGVASTGGSAGTVIVENVTAGGIIVSKLAANNPKTYTLASGTITLTGSAPTLANYSSIWNSQPLAINSVIIANSGLTVTGSGYVNLGGSNTISSISVTGSAILQATGSGAFGTSATPISVGPTAAIQFTATGRAGGGTVTLNGGKIISASNGDFSNAVVVAENSTLAIMGGTISGAITGSKSLNIVETGNGICSGSLAGYSGIFNFVSTSGTSTGVFRLAGAAANGAGTTFDLGATGSAILATSSAGTFQLGALQGSSTTAKLIGSVSSSQNVTYQIGGKNLDTTFAGLITNGTAAVAGITAVAKVGSGTLILTGSSNYTGATTIGGGTLLVAGSIAASASAVIASGGTLGGTGTVGPVTVNGGGTLAPGNAGAGILTANGNAQFSGTSAHFSAVLAQTSTTSVTQLAVGGGGTVTLNGADLALALGSQYSHADGRLFVVVNGGAAGTGSGSNVFSRNGILVTDSGAISVTTGTRSDSFTIHYGVNAANTGAGNCVVLKTGSGTAGYPGLAFAINDGDPQWTSTSGMQAVIDRETASNTRFVRIGADWGTFQPTGSGTYPTGYNATYVARLDRYFQLAAANGVRVLVIAAYAPLWASSATAYTSGLAPAPAHYADYAAYCSWILDRYAGYKDADGNRTLEALEIWNEPDLCDYFWKGRGYGREAYQAGVEYGNLVVTAGSALQTKRAQLGAQDIRICAPVLSDPHAASWSASGTSGWIDGFYSVPNVAQYYDVFTWHSYWFNSGASGYKPAELPAYWNPNAGAGDAAQYYTIAGKLTTTVSWTQPLWPKMAARGDAGKPNWLTETGGAAVDNLVPAPPAAPHSDSQVLLSEEAALMANAVNTLVSGSCTNLKRIYWFRLSEYQGYGILDSSTAAKLAYTTYQNVNATGTPVRCAHLVNGGFETPAAVSGTTAVYIANPTGTGVGWTFVNSSGVQRNGNATWGAVQAPEGIQTAYLQNTATSTASMSQSVYFPAGTHALYFQAATRGGHAANPVQVTVNGSAIGAAITPSGTAFAQYATPAFIIPAAGTYTVRLAGTTTGVESDVFVDDACIAPVPEEGLLMSGQGVQAVAGEESQ